jgi:hypothetical protein
MTVGIFYPLLQVNYFLAQTHYEINASPETGQNRHPVTLHTSIVL